MEETILECGGLPPLCLARGLPRVPYEVLRLQKPCRTRTALGNANLPIGEARQGYNPKNYAASRTQTRCVAGLPKCIRAACPVTDKTIVSSYSR